VKRLIIGCGYLGTGIAKRWRNAGDHVAVVTRSATRAADFEREGYAAIIADITDRRTIANLPVSDTVLFAVGYDRASSHSIAELYAGGIDNVLAALPVATGRFIYISSTGVYGPSSREWVDETTPPDPQRDGGRASLAAERTLAASPFGARSFILRLAGIYGPGRVPFIDKLRAGEPIPAPITGYLNLIHVDDAADAVLAADRMPPFRDGPRIYCISDGAPVQRGEYYSEVARQISAPAPQFVEPDPNSPRAARAESNRRVCSDRMLAELRVTLAYPNYRAGLAAILSS
jgi:nucleoside-diphosphate-sugar epimerase